MNSLLRSFFTLMCLALVLTACSLPATQTARLSEQQVINIVWSALEPNTSSHNQANWEVISVQSVTGQEIQDVFEGEPVPGGCAPGPTPPDNAIITPDGSYWYVHSPVKSHSESGPCRTVGRGKSAVVGIVP